jgi:hypothetical protein
MLAAMSRRDALSVLRKIALLAPLAAPVALSACGRVTAGGASEPDPRPRPEPSAANCPTSAPSTDAPCPEMQRGARCIYRESSTRCVCDEGARWQCATLLPTRGPLPPPELPA